MSVVGKSVRRADGEAKVRGSAVYGMDYVEPGMLHARLLRSPIPAGRIVRLDTAKAAAMPGVRAIATAVDAPGLSGWVLKDQRLMAVEEVRYVGEPVAAVAADTVAQAQAAVDAIELELEPLEPILTVEQALADGARLIHPDCESYVTIAPAPRDRNVAWQATLNQGDVDSAFAVAHLVVEDEFRTQRQHTSPIEPHVAVARYESGRYFVHSPTQFPFLVRDRIADPLGIRTSDVRVVVPTIGGGFGGKIDAQLEPFACILARKSGRPVRLVNTRQEELTTVMGRENGYLRLRTAVSKDGEILAQEGLILADNGVYSGETAACASVPLVVLGSVYRIPAARWDSQVVYTNTPPTTAFRGVDGPYIVHARELHVDHIARELGMDRREFRLKNLLRRGDTMTNGQQVEDDGLAMAFELIEARAPWQELMAQARPLRGVGIVPLTWLTNPGPGGATVKLNEDGTVGVITAATEIGTGAVATGVRQVVADELGVLFEDVVVLPPDTDAAQFDGGAQGSRTTFAIGNAARDAAIQVKEQVLDVAATLLEASPGDLELVNGTVAVVGAGDRNVPLSAVALTALWTSGPISAAGKHIAPPIPFDAGCMAGALFTSFAAATTHVHLAEVDVDPATGKVSILRYAVAQDVGKAINPQMIEGQIHGGVLQGIGYALFEEQRLVGGRVLEDSLETYRLPTSLDAVPIDIQIFENPCPYGPFGAKGAAEPPIVPVAAAIACAVSDALGTQLTTLPLSPFAVLERLQRERSAP